MKLDINCGCCVVMTIFHITSIYTLEKIIREPPHQEHIVTTTLALVCSNKQHVVFFDNFFTSHEWPGCQRHRACVNNQRKLNRRCALIAYKNCVKQPRGLTITEKMAVLFLWDGMITVQSQLQATIFLWHLSAKQRRVKKTNTEEQQNSHTLWRCTIKDGWRGRVRSRTWW